uniref:30S ribosomal protein S1 n=2 Tax=Cajanus cajan TaxID=3821 RepID=A0A151T4S3_CAJCA|nr:30S ribosomal protein S1 [Cajanus cajan]
MLTKEVLPLYSKEMEHLLCDVNKTEESFMVQGRMGILKNNDAINEMPVPGGTVVEIGTILFAEVLGRTLAGRPLLSTRRLFRRIAWHRLRQIKQLGEPIQVRISEWNAKGLLTRIEGLRAFLPKAELVKRVNSFTELKENIGHRMHVQITQLDEDKNNLILSEREAWEKLYLREGTLLEGTVKRILPYGAQIRIGETNRSGLLHVSNITRARITSINDILAVDEKVKVVVAKSMSPDKISLSIADLESEPGLFVSNKERVFLEAEMMAKKYREKLPPAFISQQPESLQNNVLPFENEALYANWKWFKFER